MDDRCNGQFSYLGDPFHWSVLKEIERDRRFLWEGRSTVVLGGCKCDRRSGLMYSSEARTVIEMLNYKLAVALLLDQHEHPFNDL